jgi:hypothetical protein
MPEVVFDSWLLDICLAWKVFVNIPFHRGVHIPLVHLPRIPKCEHMEHKQIEWSLYFALHGVTQTSTPSPCLKKGTWWVLDMNGMGF